MNAMLEIIQIIYRELIQLSTGLASLAAIYVVVRQSLRESLVRNIKILLSQNRNVSETAALLIDMHPIGRNFFTRFFTRLFIPSMQVIQEQLCIEGRVDVMYEMESILRGQHLSERLKRYFKRSRLKRYWDNFLIRAKSEKVVQFDSKQYALVKIMGNFWIAHQIDHGAQNYYTFQAKSLDEAENALIENLEEDSKS